MSRNYWEARAAMIESELSHMRFIGRSCNDPWLNRLRAAHAVDADFRKVMGDLQAMIDGWAKAAR